MPNEIHKQKKNNTTHTYFLFVNEFEYNFIYLHMK